MLNTENIKPGMLVPTYRDMCIILREKETSKKELREKQIERWAAYINFDRKFNTFLIKGLKEEIDTAPLLQQMSHVDMYQILLLHFLYETISVDAALQPEGNQLTPGVVQISRRELLYRLGVMNSYGKARLMEQKDCEEEKEFFSVLKNKSYYTMLTAIDKLERGKVVIAQSGYLLEFAAGPKTERVRVSTQEENTNILAAYDEAFKEHQVVDLQDAYQLRSVRCVYTTVNEILKEKYGILKHEECYTFVGIPSRLQTKLKKTKGGELCLMLLKQTSNIRSALRMHGYKDKVIETSEAAKLIVYTAEKENKRIVPEDYREKIEQYIARFIECNFLTQTEN